MTKPKAKEPHQIYGGKRPPNYLLAHNHVRHTPEFPNGMNGSRRFWIPPQWVNQGWSECSCGWGSKYGVHYARAGHVDWWKEQTARLGSLEAVHRYIIEELNREQAEGLKEEAQHKEEDKPAKKSQVPTTKAVGFLPLFYEPKKVPKPNQ
jgi:hypothetical protein